MPRICRPQINSILRFWNYDEALLRADNNILSTINNRTVEVRKGPGC